jgi:hypothetical protein
MTASGLGGDQHRQYVGRELALGVGLGLGRPAGAAAAAPVEGHHPAMARQVGDLHLPVPRLHDRPGRQQQDGRPAGAEQLVVDLDAVALDVAVADRSACPHQSSPAAPTLPLAVGRSTDLDGTPPAQHVNPQYVSPSTFAVSVRRTTGPSEQQPASGRDHLTADQAWTKLRAGALVSRVIN